jgi:hypothetical protein
MRAATSHPKLSAPAHSAAGQRDRDDLGREIGGLHPAQALERDQQRGLDLRQRAGDDLDVEHRHEHADAHRDETAPEARPR